MRLWSLHVAYTARVLNAGSSLVHENEDMLDSGGLNSEIFFTTMFYCLNAFHIQLFHT